jgi:hypothetical protein
MGIEKTDSVSYEMALIISAAGHCTVRGLNLANDYMKTLDKKDETYSIRLSGYNRAVNSTRTIILGILGATFIENRNEKVNDILIDNLMVFVPKLAEAIPKTALKQLKKDIKEKISPHVKDGLKDEFRLFMKTI